MRPQTALQQLGPLLHVPSFTTQQAARRGVQPATLAHYVKRGRLERLARGVYRATDVPSIDDFRWEDLATAVTSVKDGVICLTSALALYNLTEEIPRQHWIAIRNTTRHRADPSIRIVRMRDIETGRTEIDLGGLRLSIFDRERTIVDAFRYLSRETSIKALKAGLSTKKREERIDLERLRKYAKKLRVQLEPYLLAVSV